MLVELVVNGKFMNIWQIYMWLDENSFYGNEGQTHAQTHNIFYTSLASSAASWDTSSDKSESQLKFFNLEKWLHFSSCMYACWMASNGGETAACLSPSHFQVMPVGFPDAWRRWDPGRAGTRERAEGENMAAEDYHFYIKRMLSQQSIRAAPVNSDTIQLLVTLSEARWKPTVSQASTLFIN